jgi:polar amino acid transport system substrate-binding protein
LASFAALAGVAPPAKAAELKVATRVVPPLVIQEDARLSGFSIDLWNAIAQRMGATSKFQVYPTVPKLLDAVKAGEADLGIAAISITAERDRDFDFSQPILGAGLQILVRSTDTAGTANPLVDLAHLLLSPSILVWLGIAALLVLVPAHVVWLFERRHKESPAYGKPYWPGILDALFWAAGTLATQAESMPRSWASRLVAVVWMYVGVVFVAFYTAQLTANMTVQQMQGSIRGPDDLPGKVIATTQGSTAASYAREKGATIVPFEAIADAFAALDARQVDAVVFDAPVLAYYASHSGKGKVAIVGSVFRPEDYGIAFATDSPLRREVNTTLLSLREDGTYQAIHDRWFRP